MKMVETIGGVKCLPVGWHVPTKVCDTCKTAVALLFCRKDTLFLCLACDVKLHSHTRHERVWMCEVCEQAPASVTCKADAAALCVTCDRDIHSANPLSRRHDRVPVIPFYDCADFVKSSATCTFLEPSTGTGTDDLNSSVITNDEINWNFNAETINIDVKYPDTSPEDMKSIDLLFPEPDHLIDFDFPVPTDPKLQNQSQFNNSVNDSVVPFQISPPEKQFLLPEIIDHRSSEKCYEIDFTRSNINSYNKSSYLTQSLNHSVSSSSIEAGIVPDGKSVSEISHPFVLKMNEGSEMNGIATTGTQQPTQLSGIDREARVMRYREKRKNRKFEKTIRYASRKAYAETRPRIKGRFAKRTESVEPDVDRWLFTATSDISLKSSYGVEVEYGVVPSYCREV